MTDQTPDEPIHPLAALGIRLQAELNNAAISRDFANLMASLPDASMTLGGTFTDSGNLLRSLIPDGPVRRDVAVTPNADDPHPCPYCGVLAEEITYLGALIDSMNTSETDDGMTTFAAHVSACESAAYKPCGHRFDGATGALIGADDD